MEPVVEIVAECDEENDWVRSSDLDAEGERDCVRVADCVLDALRTVETLRLYVSVGECERESDTLADHILVPEAVREKVAE